MVYLLYPSILLVYDLYDKPLFAGASASSIYNPKKNYDPDQFGGGNEESINKMLSNDRFGITTSKAFHGADKTQVCKKKNYNYLICLPSIVIVTL